MLRSYHSQHCVSMCCCQCGCEPRGHVPWAWQWPLTTRAVPVARQRSWPQAVGQKPVGRSWCAGSGSLFYCKNLILFHVAADMHTLALKGNRRCGAFQFQCLEFNVVCCCLCRRTHPGTGTVCSRKSPLNYWRNGRTTIVRKRRSRLPRE